MFFWNNLFQNKNMTDIINIEMNNLKDSTDFLCIGFLCHDLNKNDFILGGTASYASLMARQLGKKTAVLTSVGEDFKFQELFINNNIQILNKPSDKTTVFKNIYKNNSRSQFIFHPAQKIIRLDLPEKWTHPNMVMLCPIANEVEFSFLNAFPHSLVGATIQGWLRKWDDVGKISPKKINWDLLKGVDIVFLSEADILGFENELPEITKKVKIVVITKGANGATVFYQNYKSEFPSYPTNEIDPTGAGDIFAAAFLIHFHETKNITKAAAYAHASASYVVENIGVKIPTQKIINKRYKEYLKRFL